MQVSGFEPECFAWKAKILTARLHLRETVLTVRTYKNMFQI